MPEASDGTALDVELCEQGDCEDDDFTVALRNGCFFYDDARATITDVTEDTISFTTYKTFLFKKYILYHSKEHMFLKHQKTH